MMKWIAQLESSREIWLARKISSNSEKVGVGMFFEPSRFGYRKTIFNAKKLTYNKYSCAISGMSSEMMKMDSRDNAEYQNLEKKDIVGIIGIVLNELKDKIPNSGCFLQKGAKKETWGRRKEEMRCRRFCFYFLERECLPSL